MTASAQTPEQSEAFNRGHQDWRDAGSDARCPYEAGQPEFMQWCRGFDRARFEEMAATQ